MIGEKDLLVMPMTRILLSWSTPSILESSWFTTVSFTPADIKMNRNRNVNMTMKLNLIMNGNVERKLEH